MAITVTMDFLNQYLNVFDSTDNIKLCGREETKKLINYAYKIDKGLDYGNVSTGMMNVKNLIKLRDELVVGRWSC